ncbi:MAG TPA: HAMP domain-containing sensor histidine kinase [Actinomycetota bacterium]|nr:HAMP domain-containing sensor histidine kinase [Actinomycetota bacterium]
MTLRARILLGFGAVLGLLLLSGLVLIQAQKATLLHQVDTRLQLLRQPAIAVAMPHRPQSLPGGRGRRALEEMYVGVIGSDGQLQTRLSPDDNATIAPLITPGETVQDPVTVATTGGGGQRMRVVGFESADGSTVVLGRTLTATDTAAAKLTRNLLIIGLLLVAVIGIVFWWVLRLGLSPISRVTRVARAISAGDRAERAPTFPPGTEANDLSEAFNLLVEQNQAAESRLRQFVADASHELRTPLASLTGYTSLYSAGGIQEPAAIEDAMRRMRTEANRMSRLVDELLLLAELDTAANLRPTDFDLVAAVDGLVTDARVRLPDRTITLQAPAECLVAGDPDRLTQVCAILLDNAGRHSAAGTPVEVRVTVDDDRVRVAVSDKGPGLSPAEAARVFDRFYRTDSARDSRTGGSGLGLAIAAGILQAHAGQIGVASSATGGSTFWFELPTADPASSDQPQIV